MIVPSSAKIAVLLFCGGLGVLLLGVHDLRVGSQVRDGATATACDGPVVSEYNQLRDCHVDFREAVAVHDKGSLERAFVPVRSGPGVETAIVLRLDRGRPYFGAAQAVIKAPDPNAAPTSRAIKALTIRAAKSQMSREGEIHYALLSSNVRPDYQLIEQVEGDPPTRWRAILEIIGGGFCLLCSALAGIQLARELAEARQSLG